MCRGLENSDDEDHAIFFFDQEPVQLSIHVPTFDRFIMSSPQIDTASRLLVCSETNSDNVDYICKRFNLRPLYYFFHGWAALDWFRGYDRTFLIEPIRSREIKKTFFSPLIYTGLIATILFIIATFIYILYNYIPFFDTGDSSNMMNPSARPLRLFVNEQGDPEPITSNQTEDIKVKKSFLVTLVIIFILAVIFFILKSSNSFINGFLGSSAILIIPILWVFNFYFVINYFYIYPIILIIIRFIRSFLMTGLYIMLEKKPELKDNISDELLNQLDNFKNYSPTWGLIGIDELKLLLNVFGYDNIFSKGIIAENNNSKNISNNKFISSGLFKFISNFMVTKDQSNMKGIILSIINLVVTILISCIILFGIVKVQNI